MKFARVPLFALVASIATVEALDKDKKFVPGPAASYPTKQVSDGVTVAAVPFHTASLAAQAFGKMDPYRHGVLPLLVLIENGTKESIRLEGMKVEYVDASRAKIEPTPPADVPYLHAPERPNFTPSPIPGIRRKRKNPLDGPEIGVRAFAAKMLPPGESAHGFFYFQTGHRSGAKVFVSGIARAASGKELLYFEIPLD